MPDYGNDYRLHGGSSSYSFGYPRQGEKVKKGPYRKGRDPNPLSL